MPVIAFVNPKGGAGKSTAAVVLATELAIKGAGVVMLDADPNRAITQWSRLAGCPPSLSVVSTISEATIIDEIDRASTSQPFVVVDLEGTASMTVAYAISRSDLVIIPIQGSQLDAKEGAKAITLIRQQERAFGKTIPFSVLFTRTSSAIIPRTLRHIQEQFINNAVSSFKTQLHEREAYRALFSFGGTLESLSSKEVSGLTKAIENARAFTAEVIGRLRECSEIQSQRKAKSTEVAYK